MNENVGCRFGALIGGFVKLATYARVGFAVSIRDGSGGGPQDTARPASVSELFVSEPRTMALGTGLTLLIRRTPGSHWPGIR